MENAEWIISARKFFHGSVRGCLSVWCVRTKLLIDELPKIHVKFDPLSDVKDPWCPEFTANKTTLNQMSNFCYLFFIGLLQLAVVVMGSSVGPVGLTAQDYMLCGGISTALTDLLLFPVDTIKVTQQSSKELLKFSSALSQVIKTGGLPSLYKGALGYGLMDGLGGALFFSVYEKVKRDLADRFHLSGYTLSMSLYGAAGAAFVASSVFVVPAELLKARMQTQGFRSLGHCIKGTIPS